LKCRDEISRFWGIVYEVNAFGQPEKVIKPNCVTSQMPRINKFQESDKTRSTEYAFFWRLKLTTFLTRPNFEFCTIDSYRDSEMSKRNIQILRKSIWNKWVWSPNITDTTYKSFQENGKIGSKKYPLFLNLKSTRILEQRKFDFLHIQLWSRFWNEETKYPDSEEKYIK